VAFREQLQIVDEPLDVGGFLDRREVHPLARPFVEATGALDANDLAFLNDDDAEANLLESAEQHLPLLGIKAGSLDLACNSVYM